MPSAKPPAVLALTSTAFHQGDTLPVKYTEDGDNVSPPLAWSGVPAGTKTLVLLVDDPDAPSPKRPAPKPWVHWVLYNIPAAVTSLGEGVAKIGQLQEPAGARQGLNSWPSENVGYRGPAPPPGSGVHRYFFRLYALDAEISQHPQAATKDAILQALAGHILAQGELVGRYERK